MRFGCIPPEFSPFRNVKKNIGKLNSLTVRKKKKKKSTDRPNFQILVGWGQHNKKNLGPNVILGIHIIIWNVILYNSVRLYNEKV